MSDALVVAWSAEPSRVGEVLILPDERPRVFGRGDGDGDDVVRARFARVRPGVCEIRPPLGARAISRRQLELVRTPNGILVTRVGSCEMTVSSRACNEAVVTVGDTVLLAGQLLLLCVARPDAPFPAASAPPSFAFGEADERGLIGESAATYRLREAITVHAARSGRLLLTGATARERAIVARAIHAASPHAERPFVSRDDATLEDALRDDGLFGDTENAGGTLYVEELARLSPAASAELLRITDGRRSRGRSTGVRFLASTSRDPADLPHGLAARFAERLPVPDLEERREDIPLLVRHLVRRLAETDPSIERRYFDEGREPRVAPELMDALVRHRYPAGVRDLWQLLQTAADTSRQRLEISREVAMRLAPSADATIPPLADTTGAFPTRETIQAALARCEGSLGRAAVALGLRDRAALQRLMKKRGMHGAR